LAESSEPVRAMIVATFMDDDIVPDFPAEERVVAMGQKYLALSEAFQRLSAANIDEQTLQRSWVRSLPLL